MFYMSEKAMHSL